MARFLNLKQGYLTGKNLSSWAKTPLDKAKAARTELMVMAREYLGEVANADAEADTKLNQMVSV